MIINNNYLNKNIIKDLVRREIDSDYNENFRRSYVYTRDAVDRLNQKCELTGHDGCVNCIEWNESGSMMASGSDDRKLMFWNPFEQKRVAVLDTKHEGNIFGVKFLPFSNDNIVVSCAADCAIYVHDLTRQQTINELKIHRKRVKRLATAPNEPHLFWSAGEDGYVLQHDLRCNTNEISNVLISYSACPYYASLSTNTTSSMYHNDGDENLEAKCLAINPMRTEYLAVGCNDPYARVYDRRMISLQKHFLQSPASTSRSSTRTKCVHEYITNDSNETIKYYVPGHLPLRVKDYKYRYLKQISITYLTYNLDGTELLVNISGEQVYLFDVNRTTHPTYKYNAYTSMFADVGDLTTNEAAADTATNGKKNGYSKQSSTESDGGGGKKEKEQKYPAHIESLKKLANDCFENQNYYEAIEYYNKAIELAPQWSILYGNRAAALMKRRWNGDAYAAMQDCYHALSLDKKYLKSHFRLSKCLHELKWYKEAEECLNLFCSMYPDYANSQACENLVEEIKKSIEKQKSSNAKRSASSSSTNQQSRYSNVKKERRGSTTTTQEQNESDSDDNEEGDNDAADNDQVKSNHKLEKLCFKHDLSIQNNAVDFKKRYIGHCNVATDIKEASFIGEDFIAAGSDDGSFYVWNKHNTNLVRAFKADESIVNCIQANPYTCSIATSGIDSTIKIWSPGGDIDERNVKDVKRIVTTNQKTMNQSPFDYILMNLERDDDVDQRNFCRTS